VRSCPVRDCQIPSVQTLFVVVVGAGTNGPQAARLAVARAIHAIATQAGVHIGIRRFSVINQVGAVALGASLDCDEFANAHSSDSHYDKSSFVGLAWRPARETICSEAYSTGKMNLPGSRRERHLLQSFSRMVSELFRFSSNPDGQHLFDDQLRACHQVAGKRSSSLHDPTSNEGHGSGGPFVPSSLSSKRQKLGTTSTSLWDDDELEDDGKGSCEIEADDFTDGLTGLHGLSGLDGLEGLF